MSFIPLSEPFLCGNELGYVIQCFETNFVSSVGPFVEQFEHAFARYVGASFAVACSSGTAALHIAMRLLDISPDDEVFVPTLTFVASANPIRYERATPVLVDSEPRTWNVDPDLIVEELERRARLGLKQPRAVEVVHLLGVPAEMESLAAACERYGVSLIEDASEALGARYQTGKFAGRHVGTIGEVGCFSFNGNKIMTTGGGGMLITENAALAKRAKHLTTQARLPGVEYRHDEIGYNYRLSNLAAAVGLGQLEQLDRILKLKSEIAARYNRALGEEPGLELPPQSADVLWNAWLYSVRINASAYGEDRAALNQRLRENGVEARPIWTPLHQMPIYGGAPRVGSGTVAEGLFDSALSLPSSASLSEAQQSRVINLVKKRGA